MKFPVTIKQVVSNSGTNGIERRCVLIVRGKEASHTMARLMEMT